MKKCFVPCFLIIFICFPLASYSHSVPTHKNITAKVVDYLKQRSSITGLQCLTDEKLQIGTEHEDDLFRVLFHFSPALNTAGYKASCSSKDWAFAPKSLYCTRSVLLVPLLSINNSHTWSDAVAAAKDPNGLGMENLGYVLHLLEDLTSPAHTRNDPHPPFPLGLGDPLEAKDRDFAGIPMPTANLIRFGDMDPKNYFIELQKWTQENFFSADTVFRSPGPSFSSEDDFYFYGPCPTDSSSCSGTRKIAYKGLRYDLNRNNDIHAATVNDIIADEQWRELAPKAVLFGASLLQHYINQSAPVLCEQQNPVLTINKTGIGTVFLNPPGKPEESCGPTCSKTSFPRNSVITLTALPGANSKFTFWSGDCPNFGSPNSSVVQLTSSKTCTAHFDEIPKPTLTIIKSGGGEGTVISSPNGIDCGQKCSAMFEMDTSVSLLATPLPGSVFAGWIGDCTGALQSTVIRLSGTTNRVCGASFVIPSNNPTLTVVKTGTGTGVVSSTPAGIDCGEKCTATFSPNTTVTLTAKANTDSLFSGWNGDCGSGTGDAQVTLPTNGATRCGAIFKSRDEITYEYITIEPPNAKNSRVSAISSNGRMVGEADGGCFEYSGGKYSLFPCWGVTGINDSGQIVGYHQSNQFLNSGFLIDQGNYISNINVPGGGAYRSQFRDINNDSIATIFAEFLFLSPTRFASYLYFASPSTGPRFFISIPPPPGMPNGQSNYAFAISNNGKIAGYYTLGPNQAIGYVLSNFSLNNRNGTYELFSYPGAQATLPWGINNNGDIVGYYYLGSGEQDNFLLRNGKYLTLRYPGSLRTTLLGINDAGQIVGSYDIEQGGTRVDKGFLATPK